ncbi:MAG: fatty acid cis/trans isomerase [Gammaproteobacteria bacterium]
MSKETRRFMRLLVFFDLPTLTREDKRAYTLFRNFLLKDGDSETAHYYTLLTNNAYTNISHLFNNEERRLPEEDTVSLAYDFIGAYPEILVRVTIAQLADFVTQVQALGTEEDYGRLLDDFGIRRSDPEFWQIADAMHEAFLTRNPVEGGLFDFNRLENR